MNVKAHSIKDIGIDLPRQEISFEIICPLIFQCKNSMFILIFKLYFHENLCIRERLNC